MGFFLWRRLAGQRKLKFGARLLPGNRFLSRLRFESLEDRRLLSAIRTDLLMEVPDPLSGDNSPHPVVAENLPAVGVAYTDQYFGTTLTRLTQTEGYTSRHEYSRFDPFNADQSLIVLLPEWNWRVYRTSSMPYNQPGNLILTLNDVEDPRWDPVNPNLLWGLKNFTIVNVNVTTGQETVVKDFTLDPTIGPIISARPSLYRITMQNEGEASYDMRYWAFMLQDNDIGDYQPRYVFCWDRQTDQVLGVTPLIGAETGINWVGMSPLGNYVVYGGEGAGGRFPGLTISDRTETQFLQLDDSWGHSDVGLDINGNEVLIGQTVADGQDRIDMLQLSLQAPGRTPLVRLYYDNQSPLGFNSGVHISGNCDGWAVISTDTAPDVPDQNWLDRTVTLVKLDPAHPRVWYLAKVTNTTQEYWEETQATITHDGTRVVWASNGGQNVGQEQMFLMQVEIPAASDYPITGTSGADVFRIACHAGDPTLADVFINNPGPTPSDSVPLAAVARWVVSGLGGDDLLTVDFSAGNPLPQGGLLYDGGTHAGGDTLSITGTAGNDSVTMTGNHVSMVGAALMNYSNVEFLGFNLGSGNDSLLVDHATLRINSNNVISAGTDVTIDGGVLDLNSKSVTVAGLTLLSGSILNGTLHANSYEIRSGTVTAALAGPGALFKTMTGQATVTAVDNPCTTVSGGVLNAGSIATDTLTIGAGSRVVISPIAAGATVPAGQNPPASPAVSKAASGEKTPSSITVASLQDILFSQAEQNGLFRATALNRPAPVTSIPPANTALARDATPEGGLSIIAAEAMSKKQVDSWIPQNLRDVSQEVGENRSPESRGEPGRGKPGRPSLRSPAPSVAAAARDAVFQRSLSAQEDVVERPATEETKKSKTMFDFFLCFPRETRGLVSFQVSIAASGRIMIE